ncbi:MAG: hypothetical protein ACD_7C00077G0001 [uncultured bacterium]|nr:MAG: hypothetical protein ACD_7C00077G0001 [uncultured bacterium]
MFKNKVVIVTGASSGIGAQTADKSSDITGQNIFVDGGFSLK